MSWQNYYQPPDPLLWQGRTDSPPQACFFQRIQYVDLTHPLPTLKTPHSFAFIGFACDEGIRRNGGRIGAAEGPIKIKQTLAALPLHRQDVDCFDAGLIQCLQGKLEEAQTALGHAVHLLLAKGFIPMVLGGGHELAWGSYQGIHLSYPSDPIGIVNIDAHFDMRPLLAQQRGSSGTPFLQIAKAHAQAPSPFHYYCLGIQPAGNTSALFATAKQYGTHFMLAEALQLPQPTTIPFIQHILKHHPKLYFSLCLDVFSAAIAPGVSAPQSLGITPEQLRPFIRPLIQSGQIIHYDIAELSPPLDNDSRTTKLAANYIFEIIHHHASTGSHYEYQSLTS